MFYIFDYFIMGVYYGFIALGFIAILSVFYYLFVRFKNVLEQLQKLREQSLKNDEGK
ncbi:MAG: hypothetical protein Q8N01_06035 [Sulfuricurvum sp.]|nr:hypothetical protein [Sulfuricurvum sp.]